jgi:hypothetical protein
LGMLFGALLALVGWSSSASATHDQTPGTIVYGYEASFNNSRILEYDIGSDTFDSACVPEPTANGRGIAFDPTDGNLWFTYVTGPFLGDNLIHKTTPPPNCTPLPNKTLPAPQNDIGAIDIDPEHKNLWVAGYKPIGALSFLYLIDRDDGAVLGSCAVPFGGGGVGNDTLTVAKIPDNAIPGVKGSGEYLLTDAGELETPLNGNTLLVIDEQTCAEAGGQQVQPVTTVPKTREMSGIDYENPGLIGTDLLNIYNLGTYPFAATQANMSAAPSNSLEDITLCYFGATADQGQDTPSNGQATGRDCPRTKSQSDESKKSAAEVAEVTGADLTSVERLFAQFLGPTT